MEKQLHNKIYRKCIVIFKTFILFTTFCKKIDHPPAFWKENIPFSQSHYEILFLQKSYKEWNHQNINFNELQFPRKYHKIGIPTNLMPYFSEDGCFYFLDPFYYYNEFGLAIKYCHNEILASKDNLNYFLNNINNNYNIFFSSNNKIIKIEKTTLNELSKQDYLLIYNSFINSSLKENLFNLKAIHYYYSDKFYHKQTNSIFLPKRFYETEFAILIQKEKIYFLYKKENKIFSIIIYDNQFSIDLLNLFYQIQIPFEEIFNINNDIHLDMILYNNQTLKEIRIASNNHFILLSNLKNHTNIFLFPYSYLVLDLKNINYEYNNNQLTLITNKTFNFHLNIKGLLANHWLILNEVEFIPNRICLWDFCSIKDLDKEELSFVEEIKESDCKLENIHLTEINPWGIYINNNINSYGKFIEIKNEENCINKYNKIYIFFNNFLLPLPDELKKEYYLFTASNKYYLFNNQIENINIQTYKIEHPIKLIRFFPYEEKILFNGINQENTYFIYGDKNNQVLKKIHSIVIKSEDDWEFHSHYCKNIQNCNEYAMSPGSEDRKIHRFFQCNISEVFIGGPLNENNQRISTDEFIEFECDIEENINKNLFKISTKNSIKSYYFPSPQIATRFILVHDIPQCKNPQNYLYFSLLTVPNSISEYFFNNHYFRVGQYEIEHYVNSEFPVSLNYLKNYHVIVPSKAKEKLGNCKGFATPEEPPKFEPYFFSWDYSNKNYIAIMEEPYLVQIYHNNQLLIEETVNPYQTIYFNQDLLNFNQIYERKMITIKFTSLSSEYNYEQYDEVFNTKPLCFIDSIYIDTPESIRICFLENQNIDLYLKDNFTEIKIIPYNDKYPNGNIQNDYLSNLERQFYQIQKNQCIILIEPKNEINEFYLKPPKEPFIDKYLTTSNKNKIGNGLSNKEYLEIYTYVNNQKISLCSFGFPEINQHPFYITNRKIIMHNHNFKETKFDGLKNFDREN